MQKLKINLKKAFTLVEMMIALAIFSIVLFVGYTMLNRTFLSMERQRQSLDTLHEARSFLMNIERDIREMVEVVELDTIFQNTYLTKDMLYCTRLQCWYPQETEKHCEK